MTTNMNLLPRPRGLHGKPLTHTKLIKMVEQIVSENPRRKNPIAAGTDPAVHECVYQRGDKRCIIGEVLHRLGADVSQLDQTVSIGDLSGGSLQHWFTSQASVEAEKIQMCFDKDRPIWSSAWKRYNDIRQFLVV